MTRNHLMSRSWHRFHPADIAVDLGTSKVAIFVKGEGVVVDEPSTICLRREKSGNRVIMGVGHSAHAVLGKEPVGIETIKPMRGGVIEQMEAMTLLLTQLVRMGKVRKGLAKPRVVMAAPFAVSPIERRAVYDALRVFRGKSVALVEEPLAAAMGAGMDTVDSLGNLIIDIGHGITEIAIISLGEIVSCTSYRVGGADIAEAIQAYLRHRCDLFVGDQTAERVQLALCRPDAKNDEILLVKGKNARTLLPDVRSIARSFFLKAIMPVQQNMLRGILAAFETVPPALVGDLVDRGVVLSGGAALLPGFADELESLIGVPVRLAHQPRGCVLRGLSEMLV